MHEATDGYTKILGREDSGKVHHGASVINDAEIGIAVKKLEKKIEKSESENHWLYPSQKFGAAFGLLHWE